MPQKGHPWPTDLAAAVLPLCFGRAFSRGMWEESDMALKHWLGESGVRTVVLAGVCLLAPGGATASRAQTAGTGPVGR